jgi:hypothetical protein
MVGVLTQARPDLNRTISISQAPTGLIRVNVNSFGKRRTGVTQLFRNMANINAGFDGHAGAGMP